MDANTFPLFTTSFSPLHSARFFTNSSSRALATSTTATLNGTGSAAVLTKTIVPEKYQVILLSFAYGIISFLAVVGNSCIIYIVLRNRRMRSVTNYFICNLALSDCLVACFAVPFQFQAAVQQKWVLPHFLCKLAPFVQFLSVNVSIYTLVVVSLDRYHVMLHPLKPKLSTKSAFIIFIIIWLIALASSIPSLFFYNVYFGGDVGYQCLPHAYKQPQDNSTGKSYDIEHIYVVYNIYSQYVIPFIVISCAYFRIASHLYFSKPVGQTKHQEVIARNKRKVLKMLFLVVALFLTCWFPLQLYNFLNVYKPEINDLKHIAILWLCANWLAMSNSCHNPFIYGLCSAKFNLEFRKLFSCLPCINESPSDRNLPSKSHPASASSKQSQTGTLSQRTNHQRYSSNSSAISSRVQRASRQNTTDNQILSPPPPTTTTTAKGQRKRKANRFFYTPNSDRQALFGGNISVSHNNSYYSSKKDRSIANCEKFLPDQDLTNSSKENDLLLVHARQPSQLV